MGFEPLNPPSKTRLCHLIAINYLDGQLIYIESQVAYVYCGMAGIRLKLSMKPNK